MVVSPDDVRRVRAHRASVVRRLRERGLSRATIEVILPGWSGLVDR